LQSTTITSTMPHDVDVAGWDHSCTFMSQRGLPGFEVVPMPMIDKRKKRARVAGRRKSTK
jgi:hypothetical protein